MMGKNDKDQGAGKRTRIRIIVEEDETEEDT